MTIYFSKSYNLIKELKISFAKSYNLFIVKLSKLENIIYLCMLMLKKPCIARIFYISLNNLRAGKFGPQTVTHVRLTLILQILDPGSYGFLIFSPFIKCVITH